MRELNPRAWIPSFNRYATGFDNLYYHRQMNGVGEWWCYPAGEDEPLDVEIELSTGLKDKYGEEIYEGDLVLSANMGRTPYVVRYREGDCCFVANNEFLKDYVHLFKAHVQCYEVIGNIHENPELLEVKDVD